MIVTDRKKSEKIIDRIKSNHTSLPIFCTGSHWNTEAVLMAAKTIGEKFSISQVPVALGMTYNYKYMPQAQRITHTGDPRLGFISVMKHLYVLTNDPQSPYYNIQVLPHLDHGDPVTDKWALTEGTNYLASVMFDAQKYSLSENIAMTKEYVRNYRNKIMIEGIMDELVVADAHSKQVHDSDNYAEKAFEYFGITGVDFLVADLGTEQQSKGVGKGIYLKNRAREIQQLVSDKILVLHGTSCLSDEEIASLPDDGILRVNMWTRIARESGMYALDQIKNRENEIRMNDFNSIESHRYLMDSIEKAASIMEGIMETLGYANLR